MPYQKHVFVCTNQKMPGKKCCMDANADKIAEYAKEQLKTRGFWGKEKIRVNDTGCLGHCKLGPVLVVYPDGIWYRYEDESDIDEIIEEHLIRGRVVSRLVIEAQP